MRTSRLIKAKGICNLGCALLQLCASERFRYLIHVQLLLLIGTGSSISIVQPTPTSIRMKHLKPRGPPDGIWPVFPKLRRLHTVQKYKR